MTPASLVPQPELLHLAIEIELKRRGDFRRQVALPLLLRKWFERADCHHFHGSLQGIGVRLASREESRWRLLERRAVLLDERLERQRRTAAKLLHKLVRALENAVLMVDRDLLQVLHREGIAGTLEFPRPARRTDSGRMPPRPGSACRT